MPWIPTSWSSTTTPASSTPSFPASPPISPPDGRFQPDRQGPPRPAGPLHAPPAPSIKVSGPQLRKPTPSSYRHRPPHHAHLHLVSEQRWPLRPRPQPPQRPALRRRRLRPPLLRRRPRPARGQLFVEELCSPPPRNLGLLYSAYPRPEDFPADRFLRKGSETGEDPPSPRPSSPESNGTCSAPPSPRSPRIVAATASSTSPTPSGPPSPRSSASPPARRVVPRPSGTSSTAPTPPALPHARRRKRHR